jgi:hypothetical protein
MVDGSTVKLRLDGCEQIAAVADLDGISKDAAEVIRAILLDYPELIIH